MDVSSGHYVKWPTFKMVNDFNLNKVRVKAFVQGSMFCPLYYVISVMNTFKTTPLSGRKTIICLDVRYKMCKFVTLKRLNVAIKIKE